MGVGGEGRGESKALGKDRGDTHEDRPSLSLIPPRQHSECTKMVHEQATGKEHVQLSRFWARLLRG